MSEDRKTFMVENAQLIFKNFSGREGPYNKAGERNFAVILEDEAAIQMLEDGWNVKYLEPREEEDTPKPYISVKVNFAVRPPRVVMITSGGRLHLNEASIETLDWADIETVDLICNASVWTVNGKSGVKAYLKSMYVTINEDDLDRKYAVHEGEQP